MSEIALTTGATSTRVRHRHPVLELVTGAWRRSTTRIGLAIVALVVAVAVVGPLVVSQSPDEFVAAPFQSLSGDLWLGGDALGRDVFARVMHGGRLLLALALLSALIGVALGAVVGLLVGSTRSRWGDATMRSSDVLLSFPRVVLILLVIAALGRNVWLVPVLVGLTWMPEVARVVRAVTVTVMEQDHVTAARALGIRRSRLLVGEVLPNITGPLLVEFGIRFTWSIGVVAALSFLGLGAPPGTPDWGQMIDENRGGLAIQPWGVIAPVILIVLASVGVNLITDGLAHAAAQTDQDFGGGAADGASP